MDDQRFDDILKRKLDEYEGPDFDPDALAALHQQLVAVNNMPWYSRHKTELLAGTGILFTTLMVIWSQWLLNSSITKILNEKIATIQMEQAEISRLKNQISALENSPPDTIRIIEIREQPSRYYNTLLNRIKLLEAANNTPDSELHPISENTNGKETPYPADTELIQSGSSNNSVASRVQFSLRRSPGTPASKNIHARPNHSVLLKQGSTKAIGTKTIREIEAHYQQGIGIRLGPSIEFAKGNYTEGQSDVSVNYGILGDFILSPSISLETGIKHSKRYYEIDDRQILLDLPLPGVDESIGTLQKAEIDSWMFEIPVTLKYRYPFSQKTHLLGGIGYSALFYLKQIFEYDYAFTDGGDVFTLGSLYEYNENSFYSGSINITMGTSSQLKNNKILETSLFYQYGLGVKGIEKANANFLGVRAVYWFKVR